MWTCGAPMAVLLKTNCAHFQTITQERGQTDGARLQRPACQSLAVRQDCQLFTCFFLSLLAHERRSHIQCTIYLPVVAFLSPAVCSRRVLRSRLDRTSFRQLPARLSNGFHTRTFSERHASHGGSETCERGATCHLQSARATLCVGRCYFVHFAS